MQEWYITGEAGKPWTNTAVPLVQRLISNARLDLKSLDVDTLELDIQPETIADYTAPEIGQKISLEKNILNVFGFYSLYTVFQGHVTDIKTVINANSQTLRIVVSGPWWWMERINYTSTVNDGAGNPSTRMQGVFGDNTGTNLKTALETAINRMVDLGVPISAVGTYSYVGSALFNVPRVTLNQSTCAQVITELVRLVPDLMVRFDYRYPGNIGLQIVRRMDESARTLNPSTQITSMEINPMFEMKVDRVELPYVERNREGRTVFNTQASGTGPSHRTQIITVSGPELDTFLPNDLFDTTSISIFTNYQIYALTTPEFTPGVQAGMTENSSYSLQGGFYGGRQSPSDFSGSTGYTVGAPSFTDSQGKSLTLSGGFWVAQSDQNDWIAKQLNAVEVKITGTIAHVSEVGVSPPLWAQALGLNETWYPYYIKLSSGTWVGRQLFTARFNIRGLYATTIPHYTGAVVARTNTTITLRPTASPIDNFYLGATIQASTNMPARVITAYNGTTKIATFASVSDSQRPAVGTTYTISNIQAFKAGDYSFINPPADLAANLLSAQNFIPYEGRVSIAEDSVNVSNNLSIVDRYIGRSINIDNSLPEYATMRAMVVGESIDIRSGETTLTLGTPPRLDYRTFVDRIRKTPQDNIVFT
jgi:hypothetical protein